MRQSTDKLTCWKKLLWSGTFSSYIGRVARTDPAPENKKQKKKGRKRLRQEDDN